MMLHYNISTPLCDDMDDTLIAGHYHDDVDVLHDHMMRTKPNNGKDILSQTFLMLSQTFYG